MNTGLSPSPPTEPRRTERGHPNGRRSPHLTATFDATTGLVTTTWTSTDQRDFKISFTRTAPRRETEPSYGTERYKGQFQDSVDDGDPQAHLVHGVGPELDELVWDGDGETSGTICTGTWRVAMYYINSRDERSSTAVTSVTVSGVPCAGETPDEEDEDEPAVVPAPPSPHPPTPPPVFIKYSPERMCSSPGRSHPGKSK